MGQAVAIHRPRAICLCGPALSACFVAHEPCHLARQRRLRTLPSLLLPWLNITKAEPGLRRLVMESRPT